MRRTLSRESLQEINTRLSQAHKAFERRYPGPSAERQPVHVVYGGAHLFRSGISQRFGELALRSIEDYAPDFVAFAKAVGLAGSERLPESPDTITAIAKSIENDPDKVRRENRAAWFAHTVYRRVMEKLRREPVEDFRIDFEDGYGNRPDDEEDGHAAAAAAELATGMNTGELPPFIGIRIKPFSEDRRERSIRTLDVFLTELTERTRGELPRYFYVTLPKVVLPDEVAALADLCSRIEPTLDISPGALRIELMIETTQAILNERGEVNLLPLVNAARGRCAAVHFGPYDYTASRNIVAAPQLLTHFASDFAREAMQVALAGTGVRLADGPTNTLPIAPHRTSKEHNSPLTSRQLAENREAVHRAWKIHFDNVRRSLAYGYHQGWDLHPAQLPSRYAAVYSFFLEDIEAVSERLRNFIEKAAQATRIGQVFDDAAMAQGLLNHVLQAVNCGAIASGEVEAMVGIPFAEFRTGSFFKPRQA